MDKDFIKMVCKIVGSDEPSKSVSIGYILQTFVLPKILKPYQERENGYIPDNFMKLIATFGYQIYKKDRELGEILLEIAMQRISRGCVLHKRLDENEQLPTWVHKYSAKYDVPAPMNAECFLFLLNNSKNIMECKNERLRKHMKLILFGVLNNLTESGKELYANTLNNDVWPPTLYMIAWNTIRETCTNQEIADEFSTPERILKYNIFFRANWNELDKQKLAKQLGVSGCFKIYKLKKMIFYDRPTFGNLFTF